MCLVTRYPPRSCSKWKSEIGINIRGIQWLRDNERQGSITLLHRPTAITLTVSTYWRAQCGSLLLRRLTAITLTVSTYWRAQGGSLLLHRPTAITPTVIARWHAPGSFVSLHKPTVMTPSVITWWQAPGSTHRPTVITPVVIRPTMNNDDGAPGGSMPLSWSTVIMPTVIVPVVITCWRAPGRRALFYYTRLPWSHIGLPCTTPTVIAHILIGWWRAPNGSLSLHKPAVKTFTVIAWRRAPASSITRSRRRYTRSHDHNVKKSPLKQLGRFSEVL